MSAAELLEIAAAVVVAVLIAMAFAGAVFMGLACSPIGEKLGLSADEPQGEDGEE